MAKHYPWWGYVKYLVRSYPDKRMTLLRGASTKDVNSVLDAFNSTERMDGGADRLKVIRLVHWEKTHTLEGAALTVPCGRATAARWQREFFEEVARNRGLLD